MNQKNISRRDFLKFAGTLPFGFASPHFFRTVSAQKNVLVIIFDALSAYNISLYGYGRKTTPNIDRLAEKAVVFHKHYASGNYTTTGTASLLTGTHPWTHRALEHNSTVIESMSEKNIFSAFKGFHRVAYTHNGWVTPFFKQFQMDIENWIPREKLTLQSFGNFIPLLFGNDEDIASVSWARNIKVEESGYSYSLLLSRVYKAIHDLQVRNIYAQFPRGIPTAGYDDGFTLEQAIDWLGEYITSASQPFFGYFHFLPPHSPYRASAEFCGKFNKDGLPRINKPLSSFSEKKSLNHDLFERRTEYDEFILYVDDEFGKFYNRLESAGVLDNTILVLTSDHGEINERGISGHSTSALYEPLIRIPLIIFDPKRAERLDIHTNTSAIDLLPTLAHLAGQTPPEWTEGAILPPFSPVPLDSNRSIYALRAVHTEKEKPITEFFSATLIKGRYKIHYYKGYEELQGKELIHLFDIESDPEELVDLVESQKEIADELFSELKAKLVEVNQPYM